MEGLLIQTRSTKRLIKNYNLRINNKNDLKQNMELIKTYVRGHNLFDIFYGRYRGDAQIEILKNILILHLEIPSKISWMPLILSYTLKIEKNRIFNNR